jgi:hypothetical protein
MSANPSLSQSLNSVQLVLTGNIAHYIQNAHTPEDHEAIAGHFDSEAAQAMATAEQYTVQLPSLKSYGTSEERYVDDSSIDHRP